MNLHVQRVLCGLYAMPDPTLGWCLMYDLYERSLTAIEKVEVGDDEEHLVHKVKAGRDQ